MTKDKMIYNDDQTIGVDEQSLNKLMNILTPRMQKQLVDELHNNEDKQFLNDHIQIIRGWAMITNQLKDELAIARENDDRRNLSYVTIWNDDLLYLADHCYNRIGEDRLKNICDRLLLSALSH